MTTLLNEIEASQSLVLAAEDCPPADFSRLHVFQAHDERALQGLCAHGPVLIRGGRGSGKSALMIEAANRLDLSGSAAIGVYLSLRHVPLLRSTGQEYEKLFCALLSEEIDRKLSKREEAQTGFQTTYDVSSLQRQLRELVERTSKRVVLLFDDVAHIGREASLEEFFGIFRTISSNAVSCKASIYPGVTRFGVRFDVYNDATVFDLARDERASGYADFFSRVLGVRFPSLFTRIDSAKSLSTKDVAAFLGRTVVGNMRGFVSACSRLDTQSQIGLPSLENVLKLLASDYYWPLLEELEPKLGIYEPLVETARQLAEAIFKLAGSQNRVPTVIVHRDLVQSLGKTIEILEYAGFISKREASRAMRSGGRGPRYVLNLANLLEHIPQARLTRGVFTEWLNPNSEQPTDIQAASPAFKIVQPQPLLDGELKVLALPTERLRKSNIYPYGLTEAKLAELTQAGFTTIGALASASPGALKQVPGVGDKWVARIQSVVGQAVWM